MGRAPNEWTDQEPMRVIGLISGTSCDGVDAALCEISGSGRELKVKLLGYRTEPYSEALRNRVLAVNDPQRGRTDELCRLNFRVGWTFARAAKHLLKECGVPARDVDLVGSHGQTVAHLPPRSDTGIGATGVVRGMGSTLQIGEAAVIAEELGAPVVSNFRARDMAAGGQGAPLVPYVDYLLFSDAELNRSVVNIGGISNLTWLPAGGQLEATLAFDSGPGNMLIDALIQRMTRGKERFDRDGRTARQGRCDPYLLGELLKHPYLQRKPPKSTGREEFGLEYAERIYILGIGRDIKPTDILRTVTEFTALTLADAHRRFLPGKARAEEIILSGGGALNKVLMERLRTELKDVLVRPSDDFGIPMKGKEAIAFAILARETALGRPGNLPSATGADGPRILGQITPA